MNHLVTSKMLVADRDITQAIRQQMVLNWCLAARPPMVATAGGYVTLTGSLDSLAASEEATAIALAVQGVREVDNQLRIQPPPVADEQLERDVSEALRQDVTTASYAVQATVAAGVATLRGSVRAWPEREVVRQLVFGVRGLAGLADELTYDSPEQPGAQTALADTIRELLRWDNRLSGGDDRVHVVAGQGEIRLTGTVSSALERRLVVATARAAGAARVAAEGLLVIPEPAAPEAQRADPVAAPSDEAIEAAIYRVFRLHPRVAQLDVSVYAHDRGCVDLLGTADSPLALHGAAHVAATVRGVRGINNYLRVRRSVPLRDDIMQLRVQAALARSPFLADYALDTAVFNGKVYLSGIVVCPLVRQRAEATLANLLGVETIENRLLVPHWPDTLRPEEAYPPGRNRQQHDQAVEQSVRRQLFWLPFAAARQLTVRVERGHATLTGQLDTLQQRQRAVGSAYQGGALSVDNQIKLR